MSVRNILFIIVVLCLIFAISLSNGENLEASKKYCASLSRVDCIINELTKFTCIWLNGKCEVY